MSIDSTSPGTGPLAGVQVVEVAGEASAWAGRLLADLGADVVLIEPPGGHHTRTWGPFVDDVANPEKSLWFWHYHASKDSVVVDLDSADGQARFRQLVANADVLIESEPPKRIADLLGERPERLIHAAITPQGQQGRDDLPVSDLTILAGGGPVWSCGYDDHAVPPVRGGGNQGFHTGCHYAVMGILTALVAREVSGRGQFVDVSLLASANVTTEFGSYGWLTAQETVQRQTGRHAARRRTGPTQMVCADGRHLNNAAAARRGYEFKSLASWIEELGFADQFDEFGVLQLGEDIDFISMADMEEDSLKGEIFGAGRDAIRFLATKLPAYDLFLGLQQRGLPAGIVYAPEEVMTDPHFVARGFPTPIEHEDIGRSVLYTGAPIRFVGSPGGPRRRAPHLGEHDAQHA